MKKITVLFAALLVSSILLAPTAQGLQKTSITLSSSGQIKDANSTRDTGLNYISLYHAYSPEYTNIEILNRDFSRFKEDGIDIISLSLYWYRLEGNEKGSYNGTSYGDIFLDNVKNVIAVANDYEIKVLVTFHTLWGNDSPWCVPDYVIDPFTGNNIGSAIVRSSEMRQSFIDMVKHTVTYLANTQGIWAWAILNEPWYWGLNTIEHDFITDNGQTQKENFITLIQELSSVVSEIDGRPTTVRFCSSHSWSNNEKTYIKNIFEDDWKYDQRIFDSLSFISFNAYYPKENFIEENWQNILETNVEKCIQLNKDVWISEFGYSSDDDTIQSTYFKKSLNFFESLPIRGCIAWAWDQKDLKGMNLCTNSISGQPRLAYYDLASFT